MSIITNLLVYVGIPILCFYFFLIVWAYFDEISFYFKNKIVDVFLAWCKRRKMKMWKIKGE